MKRLNIFAIIVTCLLISTGVYAGITILEDNEQPKDDPQEPGVGEPNDPVGNSTQPVNESLVNAMNAFALKMYNELIKDNEGNVFFSPYSIFVALSMTYEGARGQTAEEMYDVLGFPQNNETMLAEFERLYELYNQNEEYNLSTANAIWVMENYELLEEYLSLISERYKGRIDELDFSDEETARTTINQWVEEQTNGKIKDLIPPGALGPLTRLVLTNAIYFKGNWKIQFDPQNTTDSDFEISPGVKIKVPMMKLVDTNNRFNYTETEDLQILELPYSGDELSMIILLPKGNDLTGIEELITLENLAAWRKSFTQREIDIYLPKFKVETSYGLNDYLIEMGMPTAFASSADFSGMNGYGGLFIQAVLHKAFVEVNEEGTEAAGATAVIVAYSSIGGPTIPVFNADHPFIYLIQHKDTGNILFMGTMMNPLE